MKRFVLCILYIISIFPLVIGNNIVHRTMLDTLGNSNREEIIHYDGLGRQIATVMRAASGHGRDIVTRNVYNAAGLIEKEWLPMQYGNDGTYPSNNEIQTIANNSYPGENAPYSVNVYDRSPLARIEESFGAGSAWHNNGKANRFRFLTNIAGNDSLQCLKFSVSDTRSNPDTIVNIKCHGEYETALLHVKVTEDEDGNTAYIFTDSSGKVLLERRKLSKDIYADTYYIFDYADKITAILSPEASRRIKSAGEWNNHNSATIRDYATLFAYDNLGKERGRRIQGCAWQTTANDKTGKPVFTRKASQRDRDRWSFSFSDRLGRPCIAGECSVPIEETNLMNDFSVFAIRDNNGQHCGYSIEQNGIVVSDIEIHSVSFYDDYSFVGHFGFPADASFTKTDEFGENCRENNKALLTGTLSTIFTGNTSDKSKRLYTINYYDKYDRLIQSLENDHIGNTHITFKKYDFIGNITTERSVYTTKSGERKTVMHENTYDLQGRLISRKTSNDIGGAMSMITSTANEYDHLGRLARSSLPGITVDFGYNLRGWITSIDAGIVFRQKMHYEQPQDWSKPAYNGNISHLHTQAQWQGHSGNERVYMFRYDHLNRLKSAEYISSGYTDFSVQYDYDLNSNLKSIKRHGMTLYTPEDPTASESGVVDNLSIERSGNRLKSVTDNAESTTYFGAATFADGADSKTEYTYDCDGRLVSDLNKGIKKISYNAIGLPSEIRFYDGHTNVYTYDASGKKLAVTYLIESVAVTRKSNGIDFPIIPEEKPEIDGEQQHAVRLLTRRDYCRNIILLNDSLERILFPGGFISPNGTFHSYISGYQGNIRTVVAQDGSVKEINHYYPYGAPITDGAELSDDFQPHKYGGKEIDRLNGLNFYDFHARLYDPVLAEFITPDPMSGNTPWLSPYSYCAGNPIYYVDPTGEYNIIAPISGALIGAFTEYASIIGSKMILYNKSFKEANLSLNDDDCRNIMISAGFGAMSGALDGGISKLANWISSGNNIHIVKEILSVGVDAIEDILKQYFDTQDIDFGNILLQTLGSVGVGKILGEKYATEFLEEATHSAKCSNRRYKDLSSRKVPHERLVRNAKNSKENDEKTVTWAAGTTIGIDVAKGTTSQVIDELSKKDKD